MKRLSELSLEELTKQRNALKGVLIAFALSFLVLGCIYGYIWFVKQGSITCIPLMVLPITWIPLGISLKNLNKEIKSRSVSHKDS